MCRKEFRWKTETETETGQIRLKKKGNVHENILFRRC